MLQRFKNIWKRFLKVYDWTGKQLERLKWAGTIALVVSGLIHWQGCSNRISSESSWKHLVEMESSALKTYQIGDKQIAQNIAAMVDRPTFEQIVSEKEDLKKQLTDAKIKSAMATSVSEISNSIQLPPTIIPFDKKDTIHRDIPLNLPFHKDTSLYHIEGVVLGTGVRLINISFIDTLHIIKGVQRKNIFSPKKTIISVEHSNPFVKTNSIQNMDITPTKTIFQKPIFWFGSGMILALLGVHYLKP